MIFLKKNLLHYIAIVWKRGFCNWSMFCCTLLCVNSSFAIILIGKRELVALLLFCLSGCLVIVLWHFLTVPGIYLQFVIVVFPNHTHLQFLKVADI